MTVTRRNVRKCGGFIGTVPQRSFYTVGAGMYYADENYYARLGNNWPPGYNPVLDTNPKSPVFGSGAASTDPQLSDWGITLNGNYYNQFATLDIRWPFAVFNRNATKFYLLNAGVISATKNTASTSLSLGPVAVPGGISFHMGSGDNSVQRAWINRGNYIYQVRYEGTAATSGSVGNPNIVWEFTLFKAYQGKTYVEILFGNHARTDGLFGMTHGYRHAQYMDFGTLVPNQSYVIEMDEQGNNPILHTGYSMTGDYT